MTVPRAGLLLVDDDTNYPFLMRQAFLKEGWEGSLEVAADSRLAQSYLEDCANPLPRLILCDLRLPGMSGLELLAWVRAQQRLRLLPMVMHSWVTNEDDLLRAYDLGANAFVQKPMSFENLRGLVRTLVTYWLVFNQPAEQTA